MTEAALSKDALLAVAHFGSIENKIYLLRSNECPPEAVRLVIHNADISRPLTLLPLLHLPPEYLEQGDWVLVGYFLTPSHLIHLYTTIEDININYHRLRLEDIGVNEVHVAPRYLAQTLAVAQFSEFEAFYHFLYNPKQYRCSNKIRSMLWLAIGTGLALNPYVSMEFLFKLRPMGNYFKLAVDLNPQMGTDTKRLRHIFKLLTVDENTQDASSYSMQIKYHYILPYEMMLKRLFCHPNLPLELLLQTVMDNTPLADLAREALEAREG
ncbi:hypothetical protein MTAT_19780 [Moorella thermoacetica]|uniref:Uncharacterized protein n=1 Tax=Neomoorella thermoacetica TaxID=1525 RepID=A0AAC9HJ05_NEOTH|nr:hypothetical protein [Moorella thermoacetica]AOQ24633.1 hypothetical protein Maut_02205 [Moorella thermoacetica]TYL12736.1 hypothetical protein MTAT_19780 [Moorella thermoacetica]